MRQVREGYSKMRALLRLPFGHPVEAFGQVVDVPLIARRSRREPGEVLRRLGVDPADSRPRVLFGMRGRLPPAVWTAVAGGGPDFLFLCRESVPGQVVAEGQVALTGVEKQAIRAGRTVQQRPDTACPGVHQRAAEHRPELAEQPPGKFKHHNTSFRRH